MLLEDLGVLLEDLGVLLENLIMLIDDFFLSSIGLLVSSNSKIVVVDEGGNSGLIGATYL